MKFIKIIIPFLAFILILLNPEISYSGAKSGLILWYNTIVPTLLPFIIITTIIIGTNSIKYFTIPFTLLFKNLKDFNSNIIFPIIIGLLCGYPMGGKILNDLVISRKISKQAAIFLLPVCNNSSPMFITGYVLYSCLNNRISFFTCILLIYLPVLLYILIIIFIYKTSKSLFFSQEAIIEEPFSIDNSISDSLVTIMKIGVYIMLFSIISEIFQSLIYKNNIFPDSILLHTFISSLEITKGISCINSLQFIPFIKKASIILALCSFGGFSSIAQTASVTRQSKLSLSFYFVIKLILSLLTYFLSMKYLSFI